MAQIEINDLSFFYDGSYDMIFDHVSFRFDTDWKLGLTGRNGRGKTTLCRLLLGELPYQGRISSPVKFDYFPFPVSDLTRSGREILSQLCPEAQDWQLERELSLLGVDEEALGRPFSTLSNGERTKLMLAGLFLRENEFLLIDEPTNHLDMDGRRSVSRYLKGKKGFLLISHDRAFLDGCVDHILSINKNSIEVTKGNFSTWLHNKELQDQFELAENEKLNREIKRLQNTAREKADWANRAESRKIGFDPSKTEKSLGRRPYEAAKAKKSMQRAKAIEARRQSAIEEKSALLKDVERAMPLKLSPLTYRAEKLIECRNLAVDYGNGPVCAGVGFTLCRGDRLALRGGNGSGKSSILKLICGEDIPYSGELRVGGGLVISCVPQDSTRLSGGMREYAKAQGIDESLFKAILHDLDFSKALYDKDLSRLSAGQKKKVLIAASLCIPAHLYVWDEPLNYIDVISRMQIERLLTEYQPTLLFVEHDAAFCQNIATSTVEI